MNSTAPRAGRRRGRTSGSPMRSGLGRAVRWIDAWTVEAFNPVFPHHRGRRR